MKAVRTGTERDKNISSSRKLMGQLALGRAIVGGVPATLDLGMKPIDETEQMLESLVQTPSSEQPSAGD